MSIPYAEDFFVRPICATCPIGWSGPCMCRSPIRFTVPGHFVPVSGRIMILPDGTITGSMWVTGPSYDTGHPPPHVRLTPYEYAASAG